MDEHSEFRVLKPLHPIFDRVGLSRRDAGQHPNRETSQQRDCSHLCGFSFSSRYRQVILACLLSVLTQTLACSNSRVNSQPSGVVRW